MHVHDLLSALHLATFLFWFEISHTFGSTRQVYDFVTFYLPCCHLT